MWLLGLKELLQDLSPRNEEKQYGRQIRSFSIQSSPLFTAKNLLFSGNFTKRLMH